jgi:asparagine synthase (glutamine-hydrolysing)
LSGFAVLLDGQGRTQPQTLAGVAEAIAWRGRDHRDAVTVGPCTLLHAARWTTPEARRERLPFRHVTRELWLVADARIDNRVELQRRLRGHVQQPLDTDADLILGAYERWGKDSPAYLFGDYGFAIWDGERNELFVVRDHVGVRPVFFARRPGGVLVASSLAAVLAAHGDQPALDEEYLAGYLAVMPPPERTLWAGVERLPAGHSLRVVDGRCATTERWWTPPLEQLDQSIEETVEQVRDTFDEAVRCRLRTPDGVSCDISGGFDSSTVTATAARMGVEPNAVGLAFRANPEADETRYQHAVADHLHLDLELIEADELDVIGPWTFAATHREPLYAVDASDSAAIYDWVAARSCSVSISGIGGDEAFSGVGVSAVDLAAGGQLRAALNVASRAGMSPVSAVTWITSTLFREAAVALTEQAGDHWPGGPARPAMARARERSFHRSYPWLTAWPPTMRNRNSRNRQVSRATWNRLRYYVGSLWGPPAYELTGTVAAERGVEVRYPFLDRRLIELVLRLPESQVRWRGQFRGLHRKAFGPWLPPAVITRTDKADLSRPYMRKVLAAVDHDQARSAILALQSRVRSEPLLATYAVGMHAFDRPRGEPTGFPLWAALSAGAAIQATQSSTLPIRTRYLG